MVNGLYFLTPDRLFHPSQSMFRVHKKNQEAWLFRDGIWVPIDIYVYNEEFFALAQTIGKEYTEATNQPVRIIKEF